MNSNGTENTGVIWAIAGIVGVAAFFILKLWVAYTFWPALLLAILIAILVAILLWIGFYRGEDEDSLSAESLARSKPATTETSASVTAGSSPAPTAAAPVSTASPAAESAKPAAKTASPGAAKTKAPKPKPKAKASQKKPVKRKPAAAKTAARKPATRKAAPRKAAASKVPTGAKTAAAMMGDAGQAMVSEKKADQASAARAPVAKDGKPATLTQARAGGADDLKQIKGVGPGLEKTLNELGFYHFDQVAGWRKKEIEWVDSRLRFKGRIVRDGWIKQCKTLTKGG